MSSITKNEELRASKTEKALYSALFSLLKNLNFRKITIKGICEEALISRAAFYARFVDKYDLLKHWITDIWPKDFNRKDTYEQLEKAVNYRIYENMPVLKNLVYEADDETIDILFDFILSTIDMAIEKGDSNEAIPENVVLSNFYAGGFISYLLWQVKNKFPSAVPPMNRHLYQMIHEFQGWQSKWQ